MSAIADAVLRAAREQLARNVYPLAWSFALAAGFGFLIAWGLPEDQAIDTLNAVAKLADFAGAKPLFAFFMLVATGLLFWRSPIADALVRATLEPLRSVLFALGGLAAGAMFGLCVWFAFLGGYGGQDPATIQRTMPLALVWAGASLAYLIGIDLMTAAVRAVVKA